MSQTSLFDPAAAAAVLNPEDSLHPITVAPGCLYDGRLAESLKPYRKAAVVSQECIPSSSGGSLADAVTAGLEADGRDAGRTRAFWVADGEQHKTISRVEQLCGEFSAWGLDRGDAVVGLGGGVVTDMAGLAASVYHRGIDVVHVPTTLIGQIDAGIGGKTAVNFGSTAADGGAYKNVIGSFHPPRNVVCDPEVLSTLSHEEWLCGFGEMAKYHLLGQSVGIDPGTLAGVGSLDDSVEALSVRIAACAEAKLRIVSEDPDDTRGRRALLNYGHTMAHALEAEAHGIKHGQAVAVGLMYEACLAFVLGRIGDSELQRHRAVLSEYGLDYSMPAGVPIDNLLARMRRDKKSVGGSYGFVLAYDRDGPVEHGVVTGPAITDEALRKSHQLHLSHPG